MKLTLTSAEINEAVTEYLQRRDIKVKSVSLKLKRKCRTEEVTSVDVIINQPRPK